MSAHYSFESAEAIVYDAVTANGESTRGALLGQGFRKIELLSSLAKFSQQLDSRTPDLVVCDLAGPENDPCNILREMRHGNIGANPFAVIIMTTWRRDGAAVSEALNCGADDLIARPFSPALLAARLRASVEHRKSFVVTTDYIGPDRRRDPRPDENGTLIDVPNSLRTRALMSSGKSDADGRVALAIAKARSVIATEKMRQDAMQLCLQWRLIGRRTPNSRGLSDLLERMATLGSEIRERSQGTEYEPAAKWCESIVNCADAVSGMLQFSSDGDPTNTPTLVPMLQLLGHAAMTLGHMFWPEKPEPEFLAELDAIAARADIRRIPQAA